MPLECATSLPLQPACKSIRLRQQRPDEARSIREAYQFSEITARVLSARGYVPDQKLKNYVTPTLRDGMPAPDGMKNLLSACALISEIVRSNGGVAICCDFDVDGLTGGAQALHFLRAIGARTSVYVPDRFTEGYGLNDRMVKEIAAAGHRLLMTIDYGTTNTKELLLAKQLGLRTIVLDHHHVESAPECDVFVNPNQADCGFADRALCASGIVWYLLAGLRKVMPEASGIDVKSYLDLACLGTICDMVPLTGVNRIIARRGLEQLEHTIRPGLRSLKNVMGLRGQVSCSDVSFGLGPRLNAAGRMLSGEMVIELLTTDDTMKAGKLAARLNKLNEERQSVEASVKEEALKKLLLMPSLPAGIVVWDERFHTGVIGIVAQRLVEIYHRPTAVIGSDNNGVFKGSVRGIKDFNVVSALGKVGSHLLKFGGHAGAGGFAVEKGNLEGFAEAFIAECAARLEEIDSVPYVDADAEALLSDISLPLVNELERLSPFGMGNPRPVLLVRDVSILDVKVLKNAHLKMILSDGRVRVPGLMWSRTSHPAVVPGRKVVIACRPDTSTYNGITELSAELVAVEPA